MFPLASAARSKGARPSSAGSVADLAAGLKEGAERIAAAVVKNLQTMAGTRTTIEGMLAGFASLSTRDLALSHRPAAVGALIDCAGLPCTILASLDPVLVHTLVELVCGGDGAEAMPPSPRMSTSIDQQYAHMLVTLVAAAIQSEWATQGFGTTRAVKLEGGVAPDVCGPRVAQVGVVSIALVLFGLRGTLSLAMPPAALDAFAGIEAEAPRREESADPSWTSLLQREITRAPVRVEAYLDAQMLPLGTIAKLQPGQILNLQHEARAHAMLMCDGRVIYRGEVGQLDDRYSIRVSDVVADATVDRRPPPSSPKPVAPRPFNVTAR